jgi:hypothetical protein
MVRKEMCVLAELKGALLSGGKGTRLIMAGLALLFLTSCLAGVDKPLAPVSQDMQEAQGLVNAKPSINELCKEALEKVALKDAKALEALALNADEFKKYYWPYSKWSKPEIRMPFEFIWGDLHQKSSFALAGVLGKYGGKKLEFISVRFSEETVSYSEAKVHGAPVLTVRNEEGEEGEVKIFGAVFELNGHYKIFSYN